MLKDNMGPFFLCHIKLQLDRDLEWWRWEPRSVRMTCFLPSNQAGYNWAPLFSSKGEQNWDDTMASSKHHQCRTGHWAKIRLSYYSATLALSRSVGLFIFVCFFWVLGAGLMEIYFLVLRCRQLFSFSTECNAFLVMLVSVKGRI